MKWQTELHSKLLFHVLYVSYFIFIFLQSESGQLFLVYKELWKVI